MLILVGVTINYSLNGGIVTKAKDASSQMQVEADKETLMMAALGTIDNNGNLNLASMETPTGFTKIGTGKYTKGDYTYTINATTGAVTATKGAEEADEDLLYLESYLENKPLSSVMEASGGVFLDPNITMDMEAVAEMQVDSPESGDTVPLPILYHGKKYTVNVLFSEGIEGGAMITSVTERGETTPTTPTATAPSGINIGDTWTNVSFANIPSSIPLDGESNTYYGFAIEDESTHLFYIVVYSYIYEQSNAKIAAYGLDKSVQNYEGGVIQYVWNEVVGSSNFYLPAKEWTQTRDGDGAMENMSAPNLSGTITATFANGEYTSESDSYVLSIIPDICGDTFVEAQSAIEFPQAITNMLSGTIVYAD